MSLSYPASNTLSDALSGVYSGTPPPAESNARIRVTLGLLMLYSFLAPLGNLARFSRAEGALGMTSVVLSLILVLNLLPGISAMRRDHLLFSLVLLTLWMGFASLMSLDLQSAVTGVASFSMYVILACVVFTLDWTPRRLQWVLGCYILGCALCSSLTLIDWFGWIKIPGVNEAIVGTKTEFGSILQASGPFSRRTAMAAYFSMLIPFSLLAFARIRHLPLLIRVGLLATTLLCAITLLFTHNRSCLSSSTIVILIVSLLTNRSPWKFFRMILIGLVLFAVLAFVMMTFFHDQLIVYQTLFGLGEATSVDYSSQESDQLRVLFFKYVVGSLLSNPVGNGFTLLMGVRIDGDPNDVITPHDPHNNLTQIIWAAGVFGIGWIIYFGSVLLYRSRILFSRRYQWGEYTGYGVAIGAGLFGWLLNGMAHMILDTGMGWLLFGIFLKILLSISRDGAASVKTVSA